MVLLMIPLHKVSLKGYSRQLLCQTPSRVWKGKTTVCLTSSSFAVHLSNFSGPHSTTILPSESLLPDSAGIAESTLYWYSVLVFHHLSYAFCNNAVSHLLSPCFLPTGEYSYLGSTLRQLDIEPMPSLADVRQLIALYGILPLGKSTAKIPRGQNTMALLPVSNVHFYWLWQGLINRNLKHFAV